VLEISNFVFFQRSLVIDYLGHSCYTHTARAFSRDSTIRHLDADGDEIMEADSAEDSNDSTGSKEQFEKFMKEVALRQGTYWSLSVRTHN
jgi:solute carrier family 66 (lysosomal lysine-arginine transporter), member 1